MGKDRFRPTEIRSLSGGLLFYLKNSALIALLSFGLYIMLFRILHGMLFDFLRSSLPCQHKVRYLVKRYLIKLGAEYHCGFSCLFGRQPHLAYEKVL